MSEREPQHMAAQRMYDARASTYEDSWHPSFAADFVNLAAPQPGERVLDLACGTGLVTFLAADAVGHLGKVIGVDISTGMLGVARTRKEMENLENVELLLHSITDLLALEELEDGSFDLITCASAFVLLEDPAAAAGLWARYLKEGGRFVVDVTHPKSLMPGTVLETVGRRLGLHIPYYRAWVRSEDSLRIVLKTAGLIVDRVTFVEQTHAGKSFYKVEEAERIFEENINRGFAKHLAAAENRALVKKAFIEEWKKVSVDELVEEVDGTFVAVAHKPKSSVPKTPFLTGGCRCGKIRYSTSIGPDSIDHCHCITCRKLSGAAFLTFAGFPTSTVTFLRSPTLEKINITKYAERGFCGACGSPIYMKYSNQTARIGFCMGTIDDDSIRGKILEGKEAHIFLKEKAPWFRLPDDGVERVDEMPMMELLKD